MGFYWQTCGGLEMKRARSSSVDCTSEAQSGHWAPVPPPPPRWRAPSATGQKLLQVKHESRGGGAEKKLGVCWRENSRGHELPAVVFNAALLLQWRVPGKFIEDSTSGVVSVDASFMNHRWCSHLCVSIAVNLIWNFVQVSVIWASLTPWILI